MMTVYYLALSGGILKPQCARRRRVLLSDIAGLGKSLIPDGARYCLSVPAAPVGKRWMPQPELVNIMARRRLSVGQCSIQGTLLVF
jgi:hypothetical protein